jgi:hypothetical protein
MNPKQANFRTATRFQYHSPPSPFIATEVLIGPAYIPLYRLNNKPVQ